MNCGQNSIKVVLFKTLCSVLKENYYYFYYYYYFLFEVYFWIIRVADRWDRHFFLNNFPLLSKMQ